MIERYTRPQMGQIWSAEFKFTQYLKVELAVAQVQAKLGLIPKKAARNIAAKAHFNIKKINEIEKETKHDLIAFVSQVAETVGPDGRYLHYGLTSSDVVDTALSLQVVEASHVLNQSLDFLQSVLTALCRKHAQTICAGRTHGMFAEPTSFGFKLAGHLAELKRHRERLNHAIEQFSICKLSGAVGTYSSLSANVEAQVAKLLKLKPETIATQVVPRDRHAEVITALAFIGAGLERMALELRHLQRSEVAEVTEGFSKGQKGSSAMPHKKNPISAENICGQARLLRSYSHAAFENMALWHERDISHSSVERVIFPDAFCTADYAVYRLAVLLEGLEVHKKRMSENILSSRGQIFSSQVLLALVQKGLSREEAYRHVQRLCHSLGEGDQLQTAILNDADLKKLFKPNEVRDIFQNKKQLVSLKKVLARVL